MESGSNGPVGAFNPGGRTTFPKILSPEFVFPAMSSTVAMNRKPMQRFTPQGTSSIGTNTTGSSVTNVIRFVIPMQASLQSLDLCWTGIVRNVANLTNCDGACFHPFRGLYGAIESLRILGSNTGEIYYETNYSDIVEFYSRFRKGQRTFDCLQTGVSDVYHGDDDSAWFTTVEAEGTTSVVVLDQRNGCWSSNDWVQRHMKDMFPAVASSNTYGWEFCLPLLGCGLFDAEAKYLLPMIATGDIQIELVLKQPKDFLYPFQSPNLVMHPGSSATGVNYQSFTSIKVPFIHNPRWSKLGTGASAASIDNASLYWRDLAMTLTTYTAPDQVMEQVSSLMATTNQFTTLVKDFVLQKYNFTTPSAGYTQDFTFPLNVLLSSCQGIFIKFERASNTNAFSTAIKGSLVGDDRHTRAWIDPGNAVKPGAVPKAIEDNGVIAAQLVIGTSTAIPNLPLDTKQRMKSMFIETLEECGFRYPDHLDARVRSPLTNSSHAGYYGVWSGEYLLDADATDVITDDDRELFSSQCPGNYFMLGFPLKSSRFDLGQYVLDGETIDHNCTLRLRVKSSAYAAQENIIMSVYFLYQKVLALGRGGAVTYRK